MPRYRFNWTNLPPPLLKALCRDLLGRHPEQPAVVLAQTYRARPREEFIREAWPILRESWLRVSKGARESVVAALREVRRESGCPKGRDAQMNYLRNLRNSANLRRIVLQELIAAGENERPPQRTPRQAGNLQGRPLKSKQRRAGNGASRGKGERTVGKGFPMTTSVEHTLPDGTDPLAPGKVVRLRERLWRVDYRDGEIFGVTPLDGRDTRPSRFHAALETVEAGELPFPEPGALADDRQQRLLLDAYKFSLLHGTAPILGLQRSRAIPTDYQLVPLLMALNSDPVRLLIADDVMRKSCVS